MLRLSQVAERLNCSLSNVYALVEQGKLHAVSVGANGKGYRVSETELELFLSEGRKHPGKDAPSFPKKMAPRLFNHLNGEKLRDAWRRQGIE
jgi:excisionase family DNA binding protein